MVPEPSFWETSRLWHISLLLLRDGHSRAGAGFTALVLPRVWRTPAAEEQSLSCTKRLPAPSTQGQTKAVTPANKGYRVAGDSFGTVFPKYHLAGALEEGSQPMQLEAENAVPGG